MGPGIDGPDKDQYGIAFRTPLESLDGELGLYFMKYSSRIPYISGRSGTNIRQFLPAVVGEAGAAQLNPANFINPIPAQVAGAGALGIPLVPGTGLWEYPGALELYGLSYTTNLAGWSLSLIHI